MATITEKHTFASPNCGSANKSDSRLLFTSSTQYFLVQTVNYCNPELSSPVSLPGDNWALPDESKRRFSPSPGGSSQAAVAAEAGFGPEALGQGGAIAGIAPIPG